MSYLESTLRKMSGLPNVIGITGRKFNGKDTVADYLCKNYGYVKLSFAKPLKEVCRIMFGFTDEQLYGSLKETVDERWGVTPRLVFQYFGTELVRKQMGKIIPNLGEKFWVVCLVNEIRAILAANPNARIVIPDVRFFDEIEALRKLDVPCLLLRVVRPGLSNTDVHESEIYIDKLNVDRELLNDSTLENLYKLTETALHFRR